jgi:hypothetical protein
MSHVQHLTFNIQPTKEEREKAGHHLETKTCFDIHPCLLSRTYPLTPQKRVRVRAKNKKLLHPLRDEGIPPRYHPNYS